MNNWTLDLLFIATRMSSAISREVNRINLERNNVGEEKQVGTS